MKLSVLKFNNIFLAFVLSLVVFAGLWWLSILIAAVVAMVKLVYSTRIVRSKDWVSTLILFLYIFFIAISVRLFVFEIYHVPSRSMEDALHPGDIILMSKLNYGPKLPESPLDIPWINLFYYYNSEEADENMDSGCWDYKRLSGFSLVKRGQIIIFKKNVYNSRILVKRCVGLPGESIKIKNEKIFVNRSVIKIPPTVKQHYLLRITHCNLFKKIADSLHLDYALKVDGQRCYADCYLNGIEKESIYKKKVVDSIMYQKLTDKAYPQEDMFKWTLDSLGPIIIPAKGLKLKLNKQNYFLYQSVISKEGTFLTLKDSIIYSNDTPISEYIFKENYYVVMGDNRPNSYDSRYWGFVPESAIEGRAICILFPKDKAKKFRFFRLL